jgi:polyvinyl alcohol dehydrogenase (cytochrome)
MTGRGWMLRAAGLAAAACLAGPAATAAAATCAGAAHAGGDWPSFGRDLANSRSQPAETTIGPLEAASLRKAWSFSVAGNGGSGDVRGTPVVANGCLYAGTGKGFVFAANADTGELVWKRQLPTRTASLAYANGRIFATVADTQGELDFRPYMTALDADTGAELWRTPALETLLGAEFTGSPVPYDGMVIQGVSNFPGEDQGADDWYRAGAFRGSYVLLDQATGQVLHKQYVIGDDEFCRDEPPSSSCRNDPNRSESFSGFSGAGIWTTAAVDTETRHAYLGTGNPTSKREHPHSNAILKIDVDRSRPTFGRIVASYKGDLDSDGMPDVDFGASPNLVTDKDGRKLVGALQKTGTFHMVDRATMRGAWKAVLGLRHGYIGFTSTAAVAGSQLFVPVGPVPMGIWSLNAHDAGLRWASPLVAQGLYGPATHANGVVYVTDNGMLRAFDAQTGLPLAYRVLALDQPGTTIGQDGGVTVARNRVYGVNGDVVIAFRKP